MSEKYTIEMLYICPLVHLSGLNIVPDLQFPPRLCVVDREMGIAIDVRTKLKYDYLETLSRLYIGATMEKAKGQSRIGIPAMFCDVKSETDYKKALRLIEQLKLGKTFPNGNEVLSNKEYLFLVENENDNEKINDTKTKKLGKRKK